MKPQAIVKLLILSAVIGLVIGVATQLFIILMTLGKTLIWDGLLPSLGNANWALIAVPTLGGAAMGLCVKYFSTNRGIGFEAVAAAAKVDGGVKLIQLPRVALNAFIGLITGASIGPEAPLITIGGYIGTAVAAKLKMAREQIMGVMMISLGGSLGILLSSPIAGPVMMAEQPPTTNTDTNRLFVFASMIAASFGFGAYLILGGNYITSMNIVPSYAGFQLVHLLYALIIGVVGAGVGYIINRAITRSVELGDKFSRRPVLRGTIAGLLIGLIGLALPLVRFDGGAELSQIVSNPAEYGFWMLVLLAVARIIATAIAFAGGYQGGNIFPTIFIAGAVGLAIATVIPVIPAAVAMIACIASASFLYLKLPLFTIFLLTELSSFQLVPVMAVALTSVYILMLFAKPKNQISQRAANNAAPELSKSS